MRKLRLSNIQVNIKHKRNKKCSFIEFKTSSQLLILVPYWNPWRRFSFQAIDYIKCHVIVLQKKLNKELKKGAKQGVRKLSLEKLHELLHCFFSLTKNCIEKPICLYMFTTKSYLR